MRVAHELALLPSHELQVLPPISGTNTTRNSSLLPSNTVLSTCERGSRQFTTVGVQDTVRPGLSRPPRKSPAAFCSLSKCFLQCVGVSYGIMMAWLAHVRGGGVCVCVCVWLLGGGRLRMQEVASSTFRKTLPRVASPWPTCLPRHQRPCVLPAPVHPRGPCPALSHPPDLIPSHPLRPGRPLPLQTSAIWWSTSR